VSEKKVDTKSIFYSIFSLMEKKEIVKPNKLLKAYDGLKSHEHRVLALAVAKTDPWADKLEPVTVSYSDYQKLAQSTDKGHANFNRICKTIGKKALLIEENPRNWIMYMWFSRVECVGGDVTFFWSKDPDIKHYLCEIKSNFKTIGLETYFAFKRDYSAGMYELLKAHEHHANTQGYFWVEVPVKALRGKFQLAGKYKQYRDLKRRVIIDSLNEIGEKTDLKFTNLEEMGCPVHTIKITMLRTCPRPPKELPVIAQQIDWVENEKGIKTPIIKNFTAPTKKKRTSPGMATEKQIEWIKDLCRRNKKIIVPDYTTLTKDQANSLINQNKEAEI